MSHPSIPEGAILIIQAAKWLGLAAVVLVGAGLVGGYFIGSCGG